MSKKTKTYTIEVKHIVHAPSDATLALQAIALLNDASGWDRERALKMVGFYFGYTVTKE